ncbi:MAG: segregation/condensation protein A [Oceanospirillaceae bacterium]|nr:segregation/condensation protein A [Oceanospirillaceae bacterium]
MAVNELPGDEAVLPDVAQFADESAELPAGESEADAPAADIEQEASVPVAEADGADGAARPKRGQQEMPFAIVQGQVMTQLPLDLYIPPDALEVILEQFEGPLDLLLYLIRKQNLDILSINVFEITQQYMEYVELMKSVQLELAGEYLVMAAMLAEIKSRILLPRNKTEEDEEEDDPRAELIRRLQEYEQFKTAAENLDEMPRMERDFVLAEVKAPAFEANRVHPDVDFKELILAFAEVLHRAEMFNQHEVQREKLSTRERMSAVLGRLQHAQFVPFHQLFTVEEGRAGVVVTFLAVLELIKEQLVEMVQNELFGPIHVKAKGV